MNLILLAKVEKSRRTGFSKPFFKINGKRVIDLQIEKFIGSFKKILVVSTGDLKLKNKKIKIIKDEIKKGPLGGIYLGLKNSDSELNFVLAVDYIFFSPEIVEIFLAQKKEYDVLVPVIGRRPQFLCGIYKKEIYDKMREFIDNGNYKVGEFLKQVNVRYIREKELKGIEDYRRIFFNFNRKSDIVKNRRGV